jgi:hypothetical protein
LRGATGFSDATSRNEPMKTFDAFISYSRHDQKLVEPLVQLLSLNGRKVFWDAISIQPGEVWENSLEEALKKSRIVVVLWCCDTAVSEWVIREINLALELKKKLVPVLLCSFPTSVTVGKRQWMDLRQSVQHQCSALCHQRVYKTAEESMGEFLRVEGSSKRVGAKTRELITRTGLWTSMITTLATALLIFIAALFQRHEPPPAGHAPETTTAVIVIIAFLVIVALLILTTFWIIRKIRSARSAARDAETERLILQGIGQPSSA